MKCLEIIKIKNRKIAILQFDYYEEILTVVSIDKFIYWSLKDLKDSLHLSSKTIEVVKEKVHAPNIKYMTYEVGDMISTELFVDTRTMLSLAIIMASNFFDSDFRFFLLWVAKRLQEEQSKRNTTEKLPKDAICVFECPEEPNLDFNLEGITSDADIIQSLVNPEIEKMNPAEVLTKYVTVQ